MSLETLRLCQEGSVILSLPRFNKEVKSRFKFLPFPCPSTIAPASQPISKVWEGHCRKVSCQFKVRRGAAEQPSLLHLHGLKAKMLFGSGLCCQGNAVAILPTLCAWERREQGKEDRWASCPIPHSQDTSGKTVSVSQKEEKRAGRGWCSSLPRFLLSHLPAGGKGWK